MVNNDKRSTYTDEELEELKKDANKIDLGSFLEDVGFYDEADKRLNRFNAMLEAGKPITYENVMTLGEDGTDD